MDVLIIAAAGVMLGLLVGLLAGMLGIGGGLIIVPALVYLFGHVLNIDSDLAMPMAVATSLSTILFTGFSSALAHYRLGNLRVELLRSSGVGIAFGAIIGAEVASSIPGAMLKQIFAVLVMGIAAQMIFYRPKQSTMQANTAILLVIGLAVGVLSAIMGIGGGALLVPALVLFQVNIRHAIACAAFGGILIALFGTAGFVYNGWQHPGLPEWSVGYVFIPATLSIALTSVFTAAIGARLGQRMDTRKLKTVLAVLLVLVSIRMIIGINAE